MQKLTFSQLRATGIPTCVSDFAIAICKEHKIGRVHISLQESVYVHEDSYYTSIVPRDNVVTDKPYSVTAKTGGEFGGIVKGDLIGGYLNIPVAAYLVEKNLFCGKWYVTIYHNNGIGKLIV